MANKIDSLGHRRTRTAALRPQTLARRTDTTRSLNPSQGALNTDRRREFEIFTNKLSSFPLTSV